MRLAVLLIALAIQPLCRASDGASPTGFDASIDARTDRIVVDGIHDPEWEQHAVVGMQTSENDVSVHWKAAWDNALIYLMMDIDLGDRTPSVIAPTVKIAYADRTHVLSIPPGTGHAQEGDAVFYHASVELGSHVIVEIAIYQASIGQPAEIVEDYTELYPIALDVGVSVTDDQGTITITWMGDPDLPPNEWGAVQFTGMPGDSDPVELQPSREVLPASGGTATVNLNLFHPDAPLGFQIKGLDSDASWLSAEVSGESVIVTAQPNEGLNRSGTIEFGRYGSIRIDQYGDGGGNPWFFDEDGLRDSNWFGAFMDFQFPWIHHATLGWMYVEGSNTDSLYLYDNLTGSWFWTSESFYPNIYLWGPEEGWHYIMLQAFPEGRWCWSYEDNQWILIPSVE